MPGCPIRKSPDQSPLTAPRSLSQSSASFIASRCQGIRRAPVYAWQENLPRSISRYTLQFSIISNCRLSKNDSSIPGVRENSIVCFEVSPKPAREGIPCGLNLLRKEVIQPLVPQRLPCYDFIPITTHTLGRRMPDFGCRRLS